MRHEMLQAFLDAHGVPGPPGPNGDEDDIFAVEMPNGRATAMSIRDMLRQLGEYTANVRRHAPLPDPLALLKRAEDAERERDYLRGELAEQERRYSVMSKLLDEYAVAERAALTTEQRREKAAQLLVDIRLRLIERALAAGIPAPTLDATIAGHTQWMADQEELKTLRALHLPKG